MNYLFYYLFNDFIKIYQIDYVILINFFLIILLMLSINFIFHQKAIQYSIIFIIIFLILL